MNKKVIAFVLLFVNVFICSSESKEGYETEWLHKSLESAKGDPEAFASVLYVAALKCAGTLPNKTANPSFDLWEEHKTADRKGLQERLAQAKLNNNPQQTKSIEKEIVKAEKEFTEHDEKIAAARSQQKTVAPKKTSGSRETTQATLTDSLKAAQDKNDIFAIARKEGQLRSSAQAKL